MNFESLYQSYNKIMMDSIESDNFEEVEKLSIEYMKNGD